MRSERREGRGRFGKGKWQMGRGRRGKARKEERGARRGKISKREGRGERKRKEPSLVKRRKTQNQERKS